MKWPTTCTAVPPYRLHRLEDIVEPPKAEPSLQLRYGGQGVKELFSWPKNSVRVLLPGLLEGLLDRGLLIISRCQVVQQFLLRSMRLMAHMCMSIVLDTCVCTCHDLLPLTLNWPQQSRGWSRSSPCSRWPPWCVWQQATSWSRSECCWLFSGPALSMTYPCLHHHPEMQHRALHELCLQANE